MKFKQKWNSNNLISIFRYSHCRSLRILNASRLAMSVRRTFSPLKSIFPLSAVKLLLSSILCNNGLKIKWNWKWKERWKMTDLKGLYWDYGLLLRSESVSIIRFLAFTTNVKQLGAPFCVPVIKHALLLPSAVLQSIFDSSTWKWNERADPNLQLYMALVFLETKYFSAEME